MKGDIMTNYERTPIHIPHTEGDLQRMKTQLDNNATIQEASDSVDLKTESDNIIDNITKI